ncbi:MAG: mannose-1-phosphate guanylyltransferase [Candidatus Magasanikbacteria bacterium]|nr:mannose-1-phosphate guanylyltransferase [Candidatus Magasanikbacteria bacterium]
MNFLIFAGGAGTRLWPISRSQSPKQFEKLKDDTSTLQMAVERISSFGLENIYISTNSRYVDLVQKQIPGIPTDHIMSEPARRDLAAAVLLGLLRLKQKGISGTVALLWADHFMERPDNFRTALLRAEELIAEDSNRFIFLAEKPRFPNHNLGWIQVGKEIGEGAFTFEGWKYRPDLVECEEMFDSGMWQWNPGYFVADIDFVLGLYQKHQLDLYTAVSAMVEGSRNLETEYSSVLVASFDNAIIEKIDQSQAVVLPVDLGWSDPGTLYALKEALQNVPDETVLIGNAYEMDSSDSFIFNEEPHKLVSVIGLKGMVVVNTKDALLVVHKDQVPEIKTLLSKLHEDGKENYL